MTHILTITRTQAPALPETGCWGIGNLRFLQPAHWQERRLVEHDEAYLQPITYLLLRNASGQLWCYQRSGGDTRLDGRCSCGVGGHVDYADINTGTPFDPEMTLRRALLRELAEELGASAADLHDLRLQGLIYEGLSAVGRVHLGVLYTARWLPDLPPQPAAGEALRGLGFRDTQDLATDPQFELWSRLAAQHLLQAAP
jgi:predicted NUDIX family phosphoesterase